MSAEYIISNKVEHTVEHYRTCCAGIFRHTELHHESLNKVWDFFWYYLKVRLKISVLAIADPSNGLLLRLGGLSTC